MDIAALSVMNSQVQVSQQANIMVMKKAMNLMEQNGNAIQQLLAAASPNLGSNVDISA